MTNTTLEKWEEKTLDEVLNKVQYTSKIQSKLYKKEGKYPIISQEDAFISGYWDNPNDVYHVKHPIVIFGDHTKVVKYIDFDFVLGADGVKILDPAKYINAKFLYYWTRYVPLRNLGYARHYKLLSKKTIRFPSLPEQKRIVAKLDEAFEAIDKVKANAEQNLTNAKELFESCVNETYANLSLTEKQCHISDIAKIKGGKRVPKGYKLISQKTAHPYIRVADFDDYGSVDLSDIHYITEDIYQQISNYTISVKDLYISIAGTIGKSGIIPNALEGANLTENACKLVFLNNIYNKFVYYFTKTRYFIYETQTKTRTAAQPKLALSRLATIKIPVPSINIQQKIVEKLDALQEQTKQLEQIYTQKIKECDELKQSILQKAFRGEL